MHERELNDQWLIDRYRADYGVKLGQSTVNRWKNGRRTPRPEDQRRIREITDGAVTGDDWLGVAA
jgi:hypothetical protein